MKCENLHHTCSAELSLERDPENPGLPPLDLGDKPVSYFEFWPAWVFYVPVVLWWILLALRYRHFGLPMAVNPKIPLGGMIGESKIHILQSAGVQARSHILPFVDFEMKLDGALDNCDDSMEALTHTVLTKAAEQGIVLPCVVKPEFGCRGRGVQRIASQAMLKKYLRDFPRGERFILQRLSPYSSEVGIFYERFPGEACGRVTSLTLKYRPYVIGDGQASLRTLIERDGRARRLKQRYFAVNAEGLNSVPEAGEVVALAFSGSHCRGSVFRDGGSYITDAMSQKIDSLMRDFPEFHYGRLDVKCADIAALQRGEDFFIIEVNGVSSEKTHIWDSRCSFWRALATLLEQYRTLFAMGDAMRRQGVQPPSALTLVRLWWADLHRKTTYPPTH